MFDLKFLKLAPLLVLPAYNGVSSLLSFFCLEGCGLNAHDKHNPVTSRSKDCRFGQVSIATGIIWKFKGRFGALGVVRLFPGVEQHSLAHPLFSDCFKSPDTDRRFRLSLLARTSPLTALPHLASVVLGLAFGCWFWFWSAFGPRGCRGSAVCERTRRRWS